MTRKRIVEIEWNMQSGAALAAMNRIEMALGSVASSHRAALNQSLGEWSRLKLNIMAVESAIGIVRQAYSSLSGVIGVLRSMSAEAMAEEDQLRRLGFAVELHGVKWAEASEQVEAYVMANQRLTGVSHDVTQSLMAQIASITAGTDQNLESLMRLTDLSQDISRQTGKGVEAVATALARLVAGQETALRRVLPGLSAELVRLDEAGGSVGDMLEALERQFGGARNQLDPLARDVARVKSGWETLKEELGRSLNAAIEQSGGMTALADAIDSIAQSIAENGSAIMGFFGGLVSILLEAAGAAADFWQNLWSTDTRGHIPQAGGGLGEQRTGAQIMGAQLNRDTMSMIRWISDRGNEWARSLDLTAYADYILGGIQEPMRQREAEWENERLLREQTAELTRLPERPAAAGLWQPGGGWGGSGGWNFTGLQAEIARGRYPETTRPGGRGRDPWDELRDAKLESMALTVKLREDAADIAEAWRAALTGALSDLLGALTPGTALLAAPQGKEPLYYQLVSQRKTEEHKDWLRERGLIPGENADNPDEMAELMADAWARTAGAISDSMVSLSYGMGQFLSGMVDSWQRAFDTMRSICADVIGSMARAFMDAGLEMLVKSITTDAALGPFGWILLAGTALGAIAGALGGGGHKRGPSGVSSGSSYREYTQLVRPDMATGGGVTIQQDLRIGALFSRDSSARTVVELLDYARLHGEGR